MEGDYAENDDVALLQVEEHRQELAVARDFDAHRLQTEQRRQRSPVKVC